MKVYVVAEWNGDKYIMTGVYSTLEKAQQCTDWHIIEEFHPKCAEVDLDHYGMWDLDCCDDLWEGVEPFEVDGGNDEEDKEEDESVTIDSNYGFTASVLDDHDGEIEIYNRSCTTKLYAKAIDNEVLLSFDYGRVKKLNLDEFHELLAMMNKLSDKLVNCNCPI